MDMMQCVAHKEAKKKRKYVDATDMKERFCGNCSHENPCWVCMIFHFFNDFPAADVAEVNRCKTCFHYKPREYGYNCTVLDWDVNEDDFCSRWEAKDE